MEEAPVKGCRPPAGPDVRATAVLVLYWGYFAAIQLERTDGANHQFRPGEFETGVPS